jgi:MscS family membrane protein
VRRTVSLLFLVSLASLVSLLVVLAGTAHAQTKPTPPAPAVAAAEEEEAQDSPRVSMRTFFDLAERRRFQEASIYLDLPKGSERRGAELASKLHAVLLQRLLVNPEQLSPLARGREADGRPTGFEDLGKIEDDKGHAIPIRIVRHEPRAPDDEPRWVFAQSTVARVDAVYATLPDRWIRERLPASLLTHGPLSLYGWQWIAIAALGALSLLAGRFLSFLSGRVAARLLAQRPWSGPWLAGLAGPATLAWGLLLFTILTPNLALTIRGDELVTRGLRALAYLAFFWALLRTVTVVGDRLRSARWAEEHPGARSVSAVGVSLGKVVVAALAMAAFLSELGLPVTSIVAGLGLGGVILALAAQKTVENLLGSLSILVDRPFSIGDWVKVDTIEGRVETIGLRSTRIRTFDRTLVIFPNGKLADMRIESLEAREWIRFTTTLQVARSASPEQIAKIVAGIKDELLLQREVKREDMSVRLAKIGDCSFDIDVVAHVDTTRWAEFTRVREELLHRVLGVVTEAGAKLALPTQSVVPS